MNHLVHITESNTYSLNYKGKGYKVETIFDFDFGETTIKVIQGANGKELKSGKLLDSIIKYVNENR